MKKNDYSIIKIVIFLLGFIVIALAAVLLKDLIMAKTGVYIFSFITVELLYAAAMFPIILGRFYAKNTHMIASGMVYYKGMIIYAVISVADIVFALRSIKLTLAITIELAALFVFLVYIFLARIASDNIIDVEESEDVKKALISELRSKAQMLSSFDDDLGNMSSDMVKAIKKIDEDMRYLSPSSSSEAQELESQMLTVIDSILSSGCFRAGGNGSYELLEAKLKEFDLLYKQRKNIY